MTYVLGLVGLLVLLAGVIAYAGDRLGTWVGRRRLTLFGARPKRTGQIVGVAAGILIMLTTLGVLALAFRNATQTLVNAQRTADELGRLRGQERFLQDQVGALGEQLQALEADLMQARAVIGEAETARDAALADRDALLEEAQATELQLEALAATLEAARGDLAGVETELLAAQADLAAAITEAAAARADADAARAEVDDLEAQIAGVEADLASASETLLVRDVQLAEADAALAAAEAQRASAQRLEGGGRRVRAFGWLAPAGAAPSPMEPGGVARGLRCANSAARLHQVGLQRLELVTKSLGLVLQEALLPARAGAELVGGALRVHERLGRVAERQREDPEGGEHDPGCRPRRRRTAGPCA